MAILIEAAVESVDDALAAAAGGADRLELCSALDLGGLTPTLGVFLEVRAAVNLPICLMLRPRPGDFVHSASEIQVMIRDLQLFLPYRPAGFVLGCLLPDGRVNVTAARMLRELCPDQEVVFHRAFDRTPDMRETLQTLIDLNFTRVLTSGCAETALAGSAGIAETRKAAQGRIQVLPCGRIRAVNVAAVLEQTGCDQIHASFAEAVPEAPGRGFRGYASRSRTSRDEVRIARQVVDQFLRESKISG
jgi:copper homeostasis protein